MSERGQDLGRYELVEVLGRGAMGVVYLARHLALDRLVAVKRLDLRTAGDDPAFAQRFLREARTAGAFSHPNVVTVFDFFEHDGTPYIAMEYVERGSLRPLMGELSFAQVGGILEAVLAGLAHAARRRVVHRDLKPENLLVTADGHVKIADFGIAKAIGVTLYAASLTVRGATVGTPQYMAPEQAMDGELGPWSDLYSLGIVAYELVTGRTPFAETEAPLAVLMRHVNDPIPDPRGFAPELDAELVAWILWLLAKSPSERAAEPAAAWDALEPIVARLAGPRWRRDAALLDAPSPAPTSKSLTPAPFRDTNEPSRTPFEPPPRPPTDDDAEPTTAPDGEYATFRPPPPPRPPPDDAAEPTPARDGDSATFEPPPPPRPPTDDAPEPTPARDGDSATFEPPPPARPPTDDAAEPTPSAEAPEPVAADAVADQPSDGGAENAAPPFDEPAVPSHSDIHATLPPKLPPPVVGARKSPRRMRVLALGVAVLLVCTVVSVAVISSPDRSRDEPKAIPVSAGTSGVAVGEGAVWVSDGSYTDEGSVARIDPDTNRTAGQPIPVGDTPDDVAVGEGRVWVANYGDSTVSQIDPATNQTVEDPIPVPESPQDVAVGDGVVWVASDGGTVSRIDPTTNRRVGKPFRVDGLNLIRRVAVGAGAVWATSPTADKVWRIDPDANPSVGKAVAVGAGPEDVAVGEGAVWVTNDGDDSVSRIDPVANRTVGKPIRVGDGPDGVAVGHGAVWVANHWDDTVSRIDPATNRTVGEPIPVGNDPQRIAVGRDAVWVTNTGDSTVSRIDPDTNQTSAPESALARAQGRD